MSLGNPMQLQAGLNAGTAAGVYKGYIDSSGKDNKIDQLQQKVVASSGMPAKTYVGYKDGMGLRMLTRCM